MIPGRAPISHAGGVDGGVDGGVIAGGFAIVCPLVFVDYLIY